MRELERVMLGWWTIISGWTISTPCRAAPGHWPARAYGQNDPVAAHKRKATRCLSMIAAIQAETIFLARVQVGATVKRGRWPGHRRARAATAPLKKQPVKKGQKVTATTPAPGGKVQEVLRHARGRVKQSMGYQSGMWLRWRLTGSASGPRYKPPVPLCGHSGSTGFVPRRGEFSKREFPENRFRFQMEEIHEYHRAPTKWPGVSHRRL